MRRKILVFLSIFMSSPFLLGCRTINASVPTNTSPPPTETVSKSTPEKAFPTLAYPQQSHNGYVIATAGRDYASLFLIETESGEFHKLEIPGEIGINVYGWSEDGCTLFVGTESNDILQVDTEGNIEKKLVSVDELSIDVNVIDVKVSSDENWVAFLSGTGQHELANYEFQNLFTVSIGRQESKLYQLTNHGAVRGFTWQPHGSLLAYNENDANGIQQIFISNFDGSEIRQLTSFDKKNYNIKELQWSPDGARLAIAIIEDNQSMSYIMVADLSQRDKITNIANVKNIGNLWWASKDIVVADLLPLGMDLSSGSERIITWYNASTGDELGMFSSASIADGIFELPGQFTPISKIGFFSGEAFYAYDIFSLKIERLFNKFTDTRYWIPSPKPSTKGMCEGQSSRE